MIFFFLFGNPNIRGGGSQAGWAKFPTFTENLFWKLPLLKSRCTLKNIILRDQHIQGDSSVHERWLEEGNLDQPNHPHISGDQLTSRSVLRKQLIVTSSATAPFTYYSSDWPPSPDPPWRSTYRSPPSSPVSSSAQLQLVPASLARAPS